MWSCTVSPATATKDQTGGFFYRRPGVAQLLPVRLADGSTHDPRAALYPAGFTPQFSGDVIDYAAVLGMRGERGSGFTFDLSAGYGSDEIRYRIANTMNPSLGPDTPTRFRPGNLVNEEVSVNADFTLALDAGLATPVNFAFGFEYREEGYGIERGDALSYAVGPFARPDPFNFEITRAEVDADPADGLVTVECRIPGFEAVGALCPEGDPVNNAVPVGSNGFPGYPPTFASDVERRSHAAYVDLEADLTDRWLGNAAVRYEDFSDFRRGHDREGRDPVSADRPSQRPRLHGDRLPRADAGPDFNHQRLHSRQRRGTSAGRGNLPQHPPGCGPVRRYCPRRGALPVLYTGPCGDPLRRTRPHVRLLPRPP